MRAHTIKHPLVFELVTEKELRCFAAGSLPPCFLCADNNPHHCDAPQGLLTLTPFFPPHLTHKRYSITIHPTMAAATELPSVVEPLPPLPPSLPPSLAFLPGPFHADLISMMARADRVRIASVSPALRTLYGGTLDRLYLSSSEGRRVSALASLLQKQRTMSLIEIWPPALSALSVVMTHGYVAHVREMVLTLPVDEDGIVNIDLITHAMSFQGALQALERLSFDFMWEPGEHGLRSLPMITAALGIGGVAPVLRELKLD